MSRKSFTLPIVSFFAFALSAAAFAIAIPTAPATSSSRDPAKGALSITSNTAVKQGTRVKMGPQSSPALLKHAEKLGPHAGTAPIRITIGLNLRHIEQLKRFLHDVQDPQNPAYHHFLTPAEFDAKYGPSESDVAAVEKFLKQQGIRVRDVSRDRILIHTEGTTEAYEHAFDIRINNYKLKHRQFFSTEDQPSLPASIAGVVTNVIGLDNAVQMHPMSHISPLPAGSAASGPRSVAPNAPAPPPTTSSYYNPLQIATAYDWPSITNSDNGAGVRTAIITSESSDLSASDYTDFWAAYGLPNHTVNVIPIDGNEGKNDGLGETLLDIEYSGAMGPGETLDVYIAANPSFNDFTDAYNQFVQDGKDKVMTTSWGAPEVAQPLDTDEHIFMKAATQGISMFAAAGDNGSGDNYDPKNMADYPSVSAYITAANGTELVATKKGKYVSESAWVDTGGAISQIIPEPDWQRGPGVPRNGFRNNSDLSMNAGGARRYLFRYQGQWSLVYGTSAVAPQLAGMFAIGVSQNNGVALGLSNKLIYDDVNASPKNYGSDFHDVTTGNNGAYLSGTDWDHPTGWGSPKAKNLLSHLTIQGPAGTLKGKVTGAASGTAIGGAVVDIKPGNYSRATEEDGTYQIRLPVGDFTATASAFGYQSASASITITKDNTTTQDFALEPAPTATVSGKVTDGSGHDYPLYAEIKVMTPNFGQVADVWTNPQTGVYSLKLPIGYKYTLEVKAYFDGYDSDNATLTLDDDTTKNFALTVGSSCQAPGYAVSFGEDFNGGFPPKGWSVTNDVKGSKVVWNTNSVYGDANYTGGTGEAATAESNKVNWQRPFSTSLVAPPIAVSTLPPNPMLQFRLNFQHNVRSKTDMVSVGISFDGKKFFPIKRFTTSQGGYYALPGTLQAISLAPFIRRAKNNIWIRWTYADPRALGKDWYAQIDDVVIGACAPTDVGLVEGQVKDANTDGGIINAKISDAGGASTYSLRNAADPNLPVGYYFLFSKLGGQTIEVSRAPYENASADVNVKDGVVNVQDFPLKVGHLTTAENAFDVEVPVNGQVTKTLTLGNTGSAPVNWKLHMLDLAPIAGTSAAPATATAPGTVIAAFAAGIPLYGLGVDHDASDLWIGSPAESGGDHRTHRFLFDGTNTGDSVDMRSLGVDYLADAAYDDRTGMLWQWGLLDNSAKSCIYEFDPRGEKWTGGEICLPVSTQQRALAYDPKSNSWYSSGFSNPSTFYIYHFDARGQILGTTYVGLPIRGLAYNSSTGHLFALTSNGTLVGAKQVVVLDTKNEYVPINSFDIPGLPVGGEGAGFGYDCNNHLWVSDSGENKVFEIASGETGWCADKHIPWLTVAPPGGTITAGANASVTLTFDGTGQKAFTTSRGQLLLLGNVVDGPKTIPVNVTWEAQPVDLSLTGTASPSSIPKGNVVVYTLTVTNQAQAGHGTATDTELHYSLPAGASYVSGSGGGVSCTPPSATALAPSAASAAPGTINCDVGTLAQGTAKTITIAVQADAAGTLASTFTVSARESDNDTSNNTLTLKTTVIGTADIAASAAGTSIAAGATGTLHFEVTNVGPDTAAGVTLKLSAGSGVKMGSASFDSGSCNAASNDALECGLGDMTSGASVKVAVKIIGESMGTATVVGQARSSADDPNQGNNVATAMVTVTKGGGGGSHKGGGGGGSLGWLGLAALLALAFVGALARRRGSTHRGQGPLLLDGKVVPRRSGRLDRDCGFAILRGLSRRGPSLLRVGSKSLIGALALALALGLGAGIPAAAQAASPASAVKVITAQKFMRTPPLRDTRWWLPPIMQRIVKHHPGPLSQAYLNQLREKLVADGSLHGPRKPSAVIHGSPLPFPNPINAKDSALQRVLKPRGNAADAFTQPIVSFDGLGHSTGYFPDERATVSPEPNVAVGAKYVVQAVSSAFAVYDKATGKRVLGPVSANALWADFGGHCADQPFYPQNIGGPIVTYDQLAERWIISRVSNVDAPPVHEPQLECVAVSKTDDPTGAWYLYAFPIVAQRTDSPFLTYPKWGLWRNSYLASWYLRARSGTEVVGNVVAAFDRAQMLKGDPNAQMVEFTVPYSGPNPFGYYILPASLDGRTLPPAGEPGIFLGYSSPNMFGAGAPYALLMWRLNVDWSDPSAAQFTGPTDIGVDPFTDFVCYYSMNCIPQKGTSSGLDAVSYRLMYRLAYRNFGDHEALVVNQTVGVGKADKPPAGIRWYELDTSAPGADDWRVAQQSTFAPDAGKSRWMGSVAMDASGDMALGYSLSGPDIYPSIAYTGRKTGDPADKMTEPETILQAGGGPQKDYAFGWGDYSSMAVDPFGGCTFWYTNEYYSSADAIAFKWSTRIGAFKFASCIPAPIGTLKGTVTDAATGKPLAGATITLTGDIVTKTGKNGQYQLKLAAGNYSATASDFGYSPQTVTVAINDGQTTTQDFQLTLAPKVNLSGKVTDGSGHGYALYAHIQVTSPGFGPVADAWTDPQTGQYTIKLPKGFDYTVTADAWFDGYQEGSATLSLSADTTKNFALPVDKETCEAPGYAFAFGATFNDKDFPPAGWQIVNAKGLPDTWAKNRVWSDDNFTGGSGAAAEANGLLYSGVVKSYDTRLVTPAIAVADLPADPVLKFRLNYEQYGGDALNVDISADKGAWKTLKHFTSDQGASYDVPGVVESLDLASAIPSGTKNIRLRWRYYNPYNGNGWYAQIDDVSIGTCALLAGGLVEGQVSDANTGNGLLYATVSDGAGAHTETFANPADPNLPAGYYFLFSSAENHTITAVRPPYREASDKLDVANGSLNPLNLKLDVGELAAAPAALTLSVPVNAKATRTVKIDNNGKAATGWRVRLLDVSPPPATTVSGPFATPRPSRFALSADALRVCGNTGLPDCALRDESGRRAGLAPAAGTAPGTLVSSFTANIPFYSLGVDHNARDLWLGSPSHGGQNGDRKDHRFLFDGTDTGDTIDNSDLNVLYMADMAYDDRSGMFWQMGVSAPKGLHSCIYEINPRGMTQTGKKICPPFPYSERGLAYDPVTNTWYAGNFDQATVYHFDNQGRILDSRFVGVPIIGLAYNPSTRHLFALTSGGALYGVKQVVVLDTKHDYARLNQFDVQGLTKGQVGSGFGYDCENHLWVSDGGERKVLEVRSGETGWCKLKRVAWLTASPASGTLAAGAQATTTLTFDGTGQKEFTTSRAQIQVMGSDTPYPLGTIPVAVTWEAQSVDLALTGKTSAHSVKAGGNIVYTLTVTNEAESGNGTATHTMLTYQVPAGVSYVSGSGEGITCSASTGSSTSLQLSPGGRGNAPAAASAPVAGTVSCDLGTLAQGASKTVTIAVQANKAGTIASTFQVSAREPDSDPSNNTLTLKTEVIGTADVSASAADMTITEGQAGTLAVKVTNSGPDTATGVKLNLSAGSDAKLQSATSDGQGSCSVAGANGLDCDLGDLTSGKSVTVNVSVFGTEVGTAMLTAQATTDADDPNPGNNLAQATVTIKAASNGGGNGGGGGGGALGWLAVAALLGLVLTRIGLSCRS
jgi:uncharacterized repeat protein (TIGR01451 family)